MQLRIRLLYESIGRSSTSERLENDNQRYRGLDTFDQAVSMAHSRCEKNATLVPGRSGAETGSSVIVTSGKSGKSRRFEKSSECLAKASIDKPIA